MRRLPACPVPPAVARPDKQDEHAVADVVDVADAGDGAADAQLEREAELASGTHAEQGRVRRLRYD